MSDERLSAVHAVYEAFGRGEIDRIVELLRETEWHETQGMPYGGIYTGAQAILENVIGPIGSDVQGFSARPDELLPAGDDRVLVLGRYRGAGSAGEVDVPFAHLWTVRDGRLTTFVQYTDTHEFRRATTSG
jgi:hypothetical protein